jgi:DNA helicase-2/ATP-dependent DNA helicase PcrA
MVNGVSADMGAAPLHAHDPDQWPGGGASAALEFATQAEEADYIADVCGQITSADPAASVGVISRAAWRRSAIGGALTQRSSIPCRRWDRAIEDPAILGLIRTVVANSPRSIGLETVRTKVLATLDPGDVDTMEQVDDAFSQLGQAAPGATARAALASLRETDHETPVGPGVHLLNAHTGKGQQFDWVITCGLETGHLPGRRNSEGSALEEEQRVLLVILSRARYGLVATRSETQDSYYGRPRKVTPSPWWNTLATSATLDRQGLQRHINAIYSRDNESNCRADGEVLPRHCYFRLMATGQLIIRKATIITTLRQKLRGNA